MCVIMAQTGEAGLIEYEKFENARINNPHGMGFMYALGNKLRIVTQIDDVKGFYDKYVRAYNSCESPIVIHFRLSTGGKKDQRNCHPFYVNEDLGFCHNGTLSDFTCDEGVRCDTRVFARDILRHLPPNWRDYAGTLELLGSYIGNDKLVFLDNEGRMTIINPKQGHWKDGVWYSNYSYNYVSKKHYSGKSKAVVWVNGKKTEYEWDDDGELEQDKVNWPESDHDKLQGKGESSTATYAVEDGTSNTVMVTGEKLWDIPFLHEGRIFCVECVPDDAYEDGLPKIANIGSQVICSACANPLNMGEDDDVSVGVSKIHSVPVNDGTFVH